MKNGGAIKNLTIENSSMKIPASTYSVIKNLGFFVGNATASDSPAGTGNLTISDCHSINNTIFITGNVQVDYVGFIAGNLENNQAAGPYILVGDCSTKYSNFTSSAKSTYNFGGNFGSAC